MRIKSLALGVALLAFIFGCQNQAQQEISSPITMEEENTSDDVIQLILSQNYEQAVDLATYLMESHGVTAELLELRGIAYSKAGKRLPANEDLVAAVQMEPTVDHYYNLGVTLRQGGFCQRAVAAFEHALNLAPNDSEIMANLGAAYICFGKHAEGIASLNKALQLNPNDPVALTNMGIAFIESGDNTTAETYLKQAIIVDDNYAPAHFALYKIYKTQNKERDYDYHRLRYSELRPKSRHKKTM